MRPLRLLFLALGLASPALAADISFDPVAAVAFPSLAVPVGVRATGMGEAYTAVGDDIYALHWNPAGLASLKDYQLGLTDNQWKSSMGVRQDLLVYGQGLSLGSGLAASLDYWDLGQLEQRAADGALQGTAPASVLSGAAGYGRSFLADGRLRGGASLEVVQQTLFGTTQSGYGGGLGLLYDLRHDLTAGVSLNHIGLGLQGFGLPSSAQAGLALRLPESHLTLALEAQAPFQGETVLKTGMELEISVVRLRAGYRLAQGADSAIQSGLSAGAGFHAGMLRLDYSFTPYGELSTVHRLQATVELPRDFFDAKVVAQEGTSATAQTYFNVAKGLEAKGETLKALVQYQRCVENYPDALKSQPQPFYSEALTKVDQLQGALNKGGDHDQIHRLTLESMALAEKDAKAGRPKEAIARLLQAKRLDPEDAGLLAALKKLQTQMQDRLSTYRDTARFAAKEGDLAMGVENYRRLLALDDSDDEAQTYLAKHRKELKTLLQGMDRRAAYFYVAGKLAEAIKAWSEGEALDYFNDVDFKRNLDKARKQLELKAKDQAEAP